ncbi:MAG: ABC transporter permease, partial [Betaproteobacteria bacterium]
LAAIGGALGIALTTPVVRGFHSLTLSVFAKMPLVPETFWLQAACAAVVGVVAGLIPAWRASRIKIVDGLRHVA